VMEEGVIVAVDAVELDVDFCEELVSDEREKIDDGVEAAVVVFAPKTDELCDATPPPNTLAPPILPPKTELEVDFGTPNTELELEGAKDDAAVLAGVVESVDEI